MHITCFILLMIFNEISILHSEARPYITNIHRLNSVRDFDDVVDWTSGRDIQDTQDAENQRKFQQSPKVSSHMKERSISTNNRKTDQASSSSFTEKRAKTLAPIPTNGEKKFEKQLNDIEEIEDSSKQQSGKEQFGESIKHFYSNVKKKLKGKKPETTMSKSNLASRYHINEPFSDYYQPASVIQPLLFNQRSSISENPSYYEVRWLEHSPVSTSMLRKRREIDNSSPQQTYSLLSNEEYYNPKMALEIQHELVDMISKLNSDSLTQNNLTILPILVVPRRNSFASENLDGSQDLGHMTFRNHRSRNYITPTHGKLSTLPNLEIDHMSIILMANNTLSFILPENKGRSLHNFQSDNLFHKKPNIPVKRNVIDKLKRYFEDSFNFIDIRKVLDDEELDGRNKRESYLRRHIGNIIPGILLYPTYYGSQIFRPSEVRSRETLATNPGDYYYFITNAKAQNKYKRSLGETNINMANENAAVNQGETDIESKASLFDKEVEKDIKLDKIGETG